MGKISPVSGKYIVTATIDIDGTVEKPDVIGAIFGQTEGLLGSDLELRELQRSGRIGRIEVETSTKGGKVSGTITIPSSLDKAETAIIGAAMEIIERIGPCNAKIRVQKIEDVRISKRTHVIERAKQLLQNMMDDVMPDSTEISEAVGASVRMMEAIEYGSDKLPAGPLVPESEEVIVVEGRADVMNLLKYGFKNAIAMNGSSVPQTIIELAKEKTITLFVDGDRGGDLNTKELTAVAEIDFVVRAPDGKEVEELTQKEIHKALRGKLTAEQALAELKNSGKKDYTNKRDNNKKDFRRNDSRNDNRRDNRSNGNNRRDEYKKPSFDQKKDITDTERDFYRSSIEELLGTKGASLMDETANVLGKVPIKELESTLASLKGSVYAVALDGKVTDTIAKACDDARVKFVIGMDVEKGVKSKATTFSADQL